MQVHAVGGCVAIQRVAKYWVVQPVAVCAVHAQLVCAASARAEQDVVAAPYVVGYGLFAMLIVHALPRTVQEVGRQRQRDCASLLGVARTAVAEHCPVGFLYFVMLREQALHGGEGFVGLCGEQYA